MTPPVTIKNKPCLTLDIARRIAAAAEAEALRNGWPVAIAVVDDGGHLVCLHRLDDTQIGSITVATAKARSAIAFKRPTRAWEEALAGGRQGVLSLPGVVVAEGGVPLLWEGRMIGAVGVSGVKPAEDGQIARAGAAVLEGG